jgi:hypothetical protein
LSILLIPKGEVGVPDVVVQVEMKNSIDLGQFIIEAEQLPSAK